MAKTSMKVKQQREPKFSTLSLIHILLVRQWPLMEPLISMKRVLPRLKG